VVSSTTSDEAVEDTVPFAAIEMPVPAVRAATTFVVSVTSALASMPSSFAPSADTSRPSTLPAVIRFGTVTSPVNVAPVSAAKPVPET